MKAYIQTLNREIPDDWLFSAMLGLKNKGWEIRFFEEEDIDIIPSNKETMVVAYIEPTIKYFELNNYLIPPPLNIPDELNKFEYLRRTIGQINMKELKEKDNCPIFIKPLNKVKQFDSGVLERHSTKKYVFNHIPDDVLVQTSTLIDFMSEYRCFIYKNELKGIQWYKGDYKIFPDINQINKMINDYKNAPIAYTLDVGIVEDNDSESFPDLKTVLVECNDMWSIGHYGLKEDIYSTLLRDRWFEIQLKNFK